MHKIIPLNIIFSILVIFTSVIAYLVVMILNIFTIIFYTFYLLLLIDAYALTFKILEAFKKDKHNFSIHLLIVFY